MKKGYQWVSYFPRLWLGISFWRVPLADSLSYIYEWSLFLGWWELRKWSTRKVTA